jgi:hypothetical protein
MVLAIVDITTNISVLVIVNESKKKGPSHKLKDGPDINLNVYL